MQWWMIVILVQLVIIWLITAYFVGAHHERRKDSRTGKKAYGRREYDSPPDEGNTEFDGIKRLLIERDKALSERSRENGIQK